MRFFDLPVLSAKGIERFLTGLLVYFFIQEHAVLVFFFAMSNAVFACGLGDECSSSKRLGLNDFFLTACWRVNCLKVASSWPYLGIF